MISKILQSLVLCLAFTSAAIASAASVQMDLICSQPKRNWFTVGIQKTANNIQAYVVLSEDGKSGLYRRLEVKEVNGSANALQKSRQYLDKETAKRLQLDVFEYKESDKLNRGIEANIRLTSLFGDIEINQLKCTRGGTLTFDTSIRYGDRMRSANSKLILKTVQQLGKIANGYTAYRIHGENPQDLVEHFAENLGGPDPDRTFDWDSVIGPESETNTWGTMSFQVAQGAIAYIDGESDSNDWSSKEMARIFSQLKNVSTAAYTWHPSDYSYCGSSFYSTAIIDLEAGIVYIVHQGKSGPC